MEVFHDQNRLYPRNQLGAHVIGYTGEVSEKELERPEFANYEQGDIVGKAGIERQYNDILHGVDGQRRVVVDNLGACTGERRHRHQGGQAGKNLNSRSIWICKWSPNWRWKAERARWWRSIPEWRDTGDG
jgi:cell division protein FtsI/penicillin-binding protein 2